VHYPQIMQLTPAPRTISYGSGEAILYALGVGMGGDPLDPRELAFAYEKSLKVLPSMATVLGGSSSPFLSEGGIRMEKVVHGEQRLTIHTPLPPAASIVTRSRCASVVDKGADHGAILNLESTFEDAQDGTLYATTLMSVFCRGDGGCGAPRDNPLVPHRVPDRAPDRQVALPTRPDQALLYRLNGDRNPLHCDPDFAALAGFDRPILHGLCTYGIVCRAIVTTCCDYRPERIRHFDARFSAPVFPGETIITDIWEDGCELSFVARVAERGVTVLTNGRCVLNPA
jgi:acyl dehydratase